METEQSSTRTRTTTTTIELPWPPSVNHYFLERVVTKPGRKPFVLKVPGERGKQFRKDVQAVVWHKWGNIRPLACRLAVVIVAHMPDRRKRDLDNVLKATLDAMTKARVWADDSQIDDLRVIRGPVVGKPGRLVVTIEEIPQEQGELL